MVAKESKRSKRTDTWGREAMSEKAKRGEYTLVEPLDYMILDFLHEDGQMFAGLYPLGDTVQGLHKKFTKEQQAALPAVSLSSRLRVMNIQGLVIIKYSGVSAGGKMIWQRTKAGTGVVKKWKEEKKSEPSG